MTIVVAAAVVIERGRVLLTQRKRGSHLEGLWEFPGGKVEDGEDPRDALVRELREELGVDAEVADVVDVAFHRYEDVPVRGATPLAHPDPSSRSAPLRESRSVLLLFYAASLRAGSPEPRAIDVAALEWADASGLDPARFPPADVGVLAKVRARL